MERVQTTCNYCAISCGLDILVKNNEIKKIVPKAGYPVNPNLLCIKGLNLDKQQTIDGPKTPYPKVRQADGTMKDISWEEGFEYIAKKFTEIQEKYGQEAVAGLSTGQLLVEDFALLGHLMRNHLKTNLDGNTRLCMATAVVAHKQSFGFDSPGYTIKDFELSDTIIIIGNNTKVAHPVIWNRIRQSKKPSDRLIVIDPRRNETAQEADYHFEIEHDADLHLLYTLANLLIEQDALDHEFIEAHTNHFEEFKEFVQPYTLEYGVEHTGLTAEEILRLVALIKSGKRVSFWWCMGVNQHYEGVRVAQAIINLSLMTGNIGKPGTGANSLTGQTNAMGSRVFSNATALFGGVEYNDQPGRERIADILAVDESYLAAKPTLPYHKIIEGIHNDEIKALWVICTNPAHSYTNNNTFKEAAKKLDLLVVQDLYDDTETAVLADVVLPVVPGIKKTGTIINTERRLSPVRPALKRKEGEMTDFEVFKGIGEKLGMDLTKWETPEAVFELMKEASRGMPCDITGVEWDWLTRSPGVQWPFPAGAVMYEKERRLYEDGKFFTPNKRANFIFETPMKNPMATTKEFPTVLNTGRSTTASWHTRSRTREIPASREVDPLNAYAVIGTDFAKHLGVTEDDQITIHSSNGQTATVDVQISDAQRDDEIFIPLHYEECNLLTVSVFDPYSCEPAYKSAPVAVEKAGQA